jgi:hypothetical protein
MTSLDSNSNSKEDNNDRTQNPHNYLNELNPAQREEYDKIEAHAIETSRVKEIGDAQRIFGKVAKDNLTIDNGDGKSRSKSTDNGNGKDKKKSEHFVYKYSLTIPLAEQIIVNGKNKFLQIKDKIPVISSSIDLGEHVIILKVLIHFISR